MYQCFNCLQYAVTWESDGTFEDENIEGEGLIHYCHCANCGAEIRYYISEEEEQHGIED